MKKSLVRYGSILAFVVCFAVAGVIMIHARESVLARCADADNKPLCYSDRIEATLRTRGIPAAFDDLAVAYDHDPAFAATCHAVTHDLGKAAYEEFHKTGSTELTPKASYCGYGFYHGFLDALLVDTNDLTEARSFCTYVGQNIPHPPSASLAEGSCYHGIGHGITDGTDPRLWGSELSIVKPGLALCTKVAAGNREWERRCASGVFNALGNMYGDPKYDLHPSNDPYALCKKGGFSAVDTEACYDQMNTQAAALSGGDLQGILAFSLRISDEQYRRIALHDAVAYYVQLLKRQQKNLSSADLNRCTGLPQTDVGVCVDGLIGGVFEFGSPGNQAQEAFLVCEDPSLSGTVRDTCIASVIADARLFNDDRSLRSLCAKLPEAYRPQCLP